MRSKGEEEDGKQLLEKGRGGLFRGRLFFRLIGVVGEEVELVLEKARLGIGFGFGRGFSLLGGAVGCFGFYHVWGAIERLEMVLEGRNFMRRSGRMLLRKFEICSAIGTNLRLKADISLTLRAHFQTIFCLHEPL